MTVKIELWSGWNCVRAGKEILSASDARELAQKLIVSAHECDKRNRRFCKSVRSAPSQVTSVQDSR